MGCTCRKCPSICCCCFKDQDKKSKIKPDNSKDIQKEECHLLKSCENPQHKLKNMNLNIGFSEIIFTSVPPTKRKLVSKKIKLVSSKQIDINIKPQSNKKSIESNSENFRIQYENLKDNYGKVIENNAKLAKSLSEKTSQVLELDQKHEKNLKELEYSKNKIIEYKKKLNEEFMKAFMQDEIANLTKEKDILRKNCSELHRELIRLRQELLVVKSNNNSTDYYEKTIAELQRQLNNMVYD